MSDIKSKEDYSLPKLHINFEAITCIQKNKAQFLCSSQGCKNYAMVCGNKTCLCMKQYHPSCNFRIIQNFVQKIRVKNFSIPAQQYNAIKYIEKVFENTIQELSILLEHIRIWKQNFGLSIDQAKLINSLEINDIQELNGDFIYKIKQKVQQRQEFLGLNQEYLQLIWLRENVKLKEALNKMMKMVKNPPKAGQMNFEWDQQTLRPQFQVQDKQISIKNSIHPIMAFQYPYFNKSFESFSSIKWGIKIIKIPKQTGTIGVGICSYNGYFKNGMIFNQDTKELLQQYPIELVTNAGVIKSTSFYLQTNISMQKKCKIKCKQNDFFSLCYEPKKRILRIMQNNDKTKGIIFTDLKDLGSNDFYVPFIIMYGSDIKASLIQLDQNIQWNQQQELKIQNKQQKHFQQQAFYV